MRVIVTIVFYLLLSFICPQAVRADDAQARVLIEDHCFSNLANVIQESGVEVVLTKRDPHRIALNIADFHGMVQLDQSHWLALHEAGWTDGQWSPDYQCAVVFVVDQSRTPSVRGWHDLLESDVPVAMSHYETPLGQSTILACALALGGDEGNLAPAFTYFRSLAYGKRLYEAGAQYQYQLDYESLAKAPVAIVWDYQATVIREKLGNNYLLVFPEEGTLKIEAGLSPSKYSNATDSTLKDYLQSESGREQLKIAGFHPAGSDYAYVSALQNPPIFYTIKDHLQWSDSISNLKASWKRQVYLTKLYSTGSRIEMLLSSLLLLFLLVFWSASMFMRISPGWVRRIFLVLAGFLLWLLLLKLIKILSVDDLEIWIWYLWYTALPVYAPLWCWMCYAYTYERRPPRQMLFILIAPALFFSLAAITNDFHQGVFLLPADRVDLSLRYTHGWIYWTMLSFQVLYILWGIGLLLQLRNSRHRKKQAGYVLLFAAIILSFALLYVMKIPFFYDLDFVVVLVLLFVVFMEILARDRLLGINYAIQPFLAELKVPLAALNESGKWIYENADMKALTSETPASLNAADINRLLTLPAEETGHDFPGLKLHGNRVFHPLMTKIPGGYSLVLEDRSEVEAMIKELAKKQESLKRSNRLLRHRHHMESVLAAAREKTDSMGRLDAALSFKIRELCNYMTRIGKEPNPTGRLQKLHYARFWAGYCHRRLRISIISLNNSTIAFNELSSIFSATLKDVENLDIKAFLSARGEGRLPPEMALIIYEALFMTLSLTARRPGLALFVGLKLEESSINLIIRLPLLIAEIEQTDGLPGLSFGEYDLEILHRYNGTFEHLDDDEGSLIRLSFRIGGEGTI